MPAWAAVVICSSPRAAAPATRQAAMLLLKVLPSASRWDGPGAHRRAMTRRTPLDAFSTLNTSICTMLRPSFFAR